MSFFLNTTVCGFTLYQILAYFLVYSCLGWCLEVVYAAATTGQIVNRGFLNGPVCPIYGFGMVIVLFVLTPFEHSTLALYIGGVILPSALELVGGWALYKLYHTRWWDYSDKPFNIGGYICLEFSLLWGVGTLVMMKAIHPTIAGLVGLVPPFIGFLLMCFLYAVYAADVVVTAVAASDLARELDALENVADSIHAVSDAMTEILGTTAMEADQKLDENRLQFKLAAAEARDAAAQLSPKEAAEAMRRKAWKIQEDRTMIKLIVGAKGSGKTKAMIDQINDSVKTSKGNVVVVEKGMKLTYDIAPAARLIDLDEYKVSGGEMLYGFVAGLLASNYDITDLYIDGILKVLNHDINRLGVVLDEMAAIAGDTVKVTVTVSADEAALPHDVKKYL